MFTPGEMMSSTKCRRILFHQSWIKKEKNWWNILSSFKMEGVSLQPLIFLGDRFYPGTYSFLFSIFLQFVEEWYSKNSVRKELNSLSFFFERSSSSEREGRIPLSRGCSSSFLFYLRAINWNGSIFWALNLCLSLSVVALS